MAKSVGILTTTGGLASHAAVVARGWDIPAVVGAVGVVVGEGMVAIADVTYREGDVLSIDGSSGEVFGGAVTAVTTVVPEAVTLLEWARDLGIVIGEADAAGAAAAVAGNPDASVGRDEVIRALAIKGYAMADMLGLALGVEADEAAALAERLVADGIAKDAGGMFSLTDDGKALGAERISADREAWGVDNATAALDAFIVLDHQMKDIVTAWQMKEVDGEQVLNDHADAEYDAAVLQRLADLHVETTAWISPLFEGLPRLRSYGTRLDEAAEKAAAGDGMYIASPRVDSYHGVWFELHEDLIRLSGKTREEEVAAGRA
jgi:pyruvate,orthophosphate dikinase